MREMKGKRQETGDVLHTKKEIETITKAHKEKKGKERKLQRKKYIHCI